MIRVLVVDDSALMRHVLSDILNSDPDIDVVGVAADPYIAREKIKRLNPDMITLDVEMPKMDGLQFLRNIMRLRPMPVLMVSSLTQAGAAVTLEALEIGAVDFVAKPEIDIAQGLRDYAKELIAKVKMTAAARVLRRSFSDEQRRTTQPILTPADPLNFRTTDRVLAIGASTGGTEAIREVLSALPADTPGTVIVQHIPGMFSGPFARRMDGCSQMVVREAIDGERILQGHAYIAPGDQHLSIRRDGARYYCQLDSGPPVNRHRPSVDVLFQSVAEQVGRNATGVLLTGMGKDGAEGMKAMLEQGANTLIQDEASSVVWGMPGAAMKIGAAQEVLPLKRIAERLIALHRPVEARRKA